LKDDNDIFGLAFFLAFYLTDILTFFLAFYQAFCLAFYLTGGGRRGRRRGAAPLLKSRALIWQVGNKSLNWVAGVETAAFQSEL
jgi:hypothetical protein